MTGQLTEAEAYRAILDCEPHLRLWQDRVRTHEEPERGSELQLDDAVFPRHRISEICRYSLATSGEHLRLAIDAIHRSNVYPGAHYTAVRGALVGASQAVWILSPDVPGLRQSRGHCAISESDKYLVKHYERALKMPGWDVAMRTRIEGQIAYMQDRRTQLARIRSDNNSLNVTSMIEEVARQEFTSDQAVNIVLEWTRMSSDAHVLGWGSAQRAPAGVPVPGTADDIRPLQGNLQQLAEPFIASYMLLKQGWSLFDRRCEEPQPTRVWRSQV